MAENCEHGRTCGLEICSILNTSQPLQLDQAFFNAQSSAEACEDDLFRAFVVQVYLSGDTPSWNMSLFVNIASLVPCGTFSSALESGGPGVKHSETHDISFWTSSAQNLSGLVTLNETSSPLAIQVGAPLRSAPNRPSSAAASRAREAGKGTD